VDKSGGNWIELSTVGQLNTPLDTQDYAQFGRQNLQGQYPRLADWPLMCLWYVMVVHGRQPGGKQGNVAIPPARDRSV